MAPFDRSVIYKVLSLMEKKRSKRRKKRRLNSVYLIARPDISGPAVATDRICFPTDDNT
jgi:hypothetical protein